MQCDVVYESVNDKDNKEDDLFLECILNVCYGDDPNKEGDDSRYDAVHFNQLGEFLLFIFVMMDVSFDIHYRDKSNGDAEYEQWISHFNFSIDVA